MATFADEIMNYSLALWTSFLAASGCISHIMCSLLLYILNENVGLCLILSSETLSTHGQTPGVRICMFLHAQCSIVSCFSCFRNLTKDKEQRK